MPHRCGQSRSGFDRLAEDIEVVDGERSSAASRIAETVHIGGEQSSNPPGHAVSEVLGEQELGVDSDSPRHHGERDQLPCELATPQLDEACLDRRRHPYTQVRVVSEEGPRRGQPLPSMARVPCSPSRGLPGGGELGGQRTRRQVHIAGRSLRRGVPYQLPQCQQIDPRRRQLGPVDVSPG